MTKKAVLILALCLLLIIAAIAIWITRPVTVDWSTTAYLFAADGTAETSFPITIKGKIKDEPDNELLVWAYLDIDLPKDFRYSGATSDVGEPGWKGTELKGTDPNDLRIAAMLYDKEANAGATCFYFINPELGYFMAYWPDDDGSYLVAAADSNVKTEDVLAHFQPYCEVWGIGNAETPSETSPDTTPSTTPETQPTDPNATYIDWSLHGTWISPDNQVIESNAVAITIDGTIARNEYDQNTVECQIAFSSDTFEYTCGSATGVENDIDTSPYFVCPYRPYYSTSQPQVLPYFALSLEHGYAIFAKADDLGNYLIASKDPETDPQEIFDYFQDFIAVYISDGDPGNAIDLSMTAYVFAADGTAETSFPITIKGNTRDKVDNQQMVYLSLEIDLPKDFRYRYIVPDTGDIGWNGTELKDGNPSDVRVATFTYDCEANKPATCHYVINPELGYFMACWPSGDGSYLVAVADPNVTTADVLAHFQPYCELLGIANSDTPSETQPTDPSPTESTETTDSTSSTEHTSTLDTYPSGFGSSAISCKHHYGGSVDRVFPDAYSGIIGKYTVVFSVEELQSFFIDELGLEQLPWHAERFDEAYFFSNALVVGTFSEIYQATYIGIADAYKTDDGDINLVIEHYRPSRVYSELNENIQYIELQGVSDPTNVNIEIIDEGNDPPYEDLQ